MCNRGYMPAYHPFPASFSLTHEHREKRESGLYKSIIYTIVRPYHAHPKRREPSAATHPHLVPAPYFTNDSTSFFGGGESGSEAALAMVVQYRDGDGRVVVVVVAMVVVVVVHYTAP